MTLLTTNQAESPSLYDSQLGPGATCPKDARARAFGKTIIVGEHAVVYGAKAVAMPVFSVQMDVALTPGASHFKGERPPIRVTLGGRSVTEHLRGVVDDAFACLDIQPFELDLDGHSSVLVGAGLGSSASLCIVVLRALAAATGKNVSKKQLSDMANQLERRFHGNPSGLDTAVVAWEEVICFAKGMPPIPVPIRRPKEGPWRFAVLDSRARSSTLDMVHKAAPYFSGTAGSSHIQRFDQLADAVSQGLASGDSAIVAAAMDEAGAHLKSAGIVNAPLEDLIETAKSAGALSSKVTGAGGGGCVLALLNPLNAESQVARLKSQLGSHRVFEVELA